MITKQVPSHPVNIYMAGDMDVAAHICRKFCDEVGLCVRIYESFYVYTNGSEPGFTISLMNYPRFPTNWWNIDDHAKKLGFLLMDACRQESFSIESPRFTWWFSNRKEDNETVS